jgi:hypothetical protein
MTFCTELAWITNGNTKNIINNARATIENQYAN